MANHKQHSKQNDLLLRRYLSGEIDAVGEAELFRAAREDEGLAAALAGYQLQPETDHQGSLNKLRTRLPRAERKRLIPLKAVSIAASLLLILTVGYWGYQSNQFGRGSNDYATATEAAPLADSEAPPREQKSAEQENLPATPGQTVPPVIEREPVPEARAARGTTTPQRSDESEVGTISPAQTAPAAAAPASPAPPAAVAAEPEPEMAEDEAVTFEDAAPVSAFADAENLGREEKKARSAVSRPMGARVISGYVTDENDRPINNANITLPGQPIGESTDSSGYFEFVADQTVRQLRVGHPDFENSEIQLPRNENELVINLSKPAGLAEEETVDDDWLISGARTTIYPNAEKTSATVKGGIRELRRELQAAKPADLPAGVVKVSFSVQPDGSLTDFSFGRKSEAQLLDFVRNYLQQNSEWELRGGDTPTRMVITFRLR